MRHCDSRYSYDTGVWTRSIEFAGRIGHEGRKVIALQSDLTERNEKFDEYERLTDQYEEELRNRDFDKNGDKEGRLL